MPSTSCGAGSITRLTTETASHIQSAYEISSPLCIVQELVRNSAEALASKITISLSANGLEIIQVVDDGIGISRDSLSLLAQRGCTSKSPNVGRGSALAAIVTISTQVKICTRPHNSDVGAQVVLDDSNRVQDIKSIASNVGTSVTVTRPLSKLPVRYNLVKTQTARIKKEIREWVVAFCLINHNISVSLATLGQTQRMTGSIAFTRTPSLLDAVIHFLGSCHKDSVTEIDYPSTESNEVLPAAASLSSSSKSRMAGITYEGAFSVPQRSNKVETTKLPKLSVSVNGVVCKSNVFPSLVRHLNQQHCIAEQDNEKDNSNSSNKRFLGVLNVTVPVEMLDTSSRTPWFVSTYESECIEAMIVDRLTSVFEDKTATLAPQQLVTRKTLPLLDWSRGKCGIDEPTSIHLPITQRSKRKATRLSADDTRSKSSRDKRVVKPKHMQIQALTDAISLADKVSERARIPQVKWSTHSGRLYEALASNSVSNVICVLRSDGSATTPEAMNSCTASTNAKPVAYLVTNPQDNIVALDIRNQPIPKNGAPCSIQLGPEMRPYAAIAQINQDGL